jgi:hypothetical protein
VDADRRFEDRVLRDVQVRQRAGRVEEEELVVGDFVDDEQARAVFVQLDAGVAAAEGQVVTLAVAGRR